MLIQHKRQDLSLVLRKIGRIKYPHFALPAVFPILVASHYSSATDFNITRATNLQLVNLDTESVSASLPTCHWMLLLPLYLLLI